MKKTVKDAIGNLKPLKVCQCDQKDKHHCAPCLKPETVKILKHLKSGEKRWESFGGAGRRLFNNKPSYTITTMSEHIHPTQNRGLTIRELARIQSFPDSYKFEGSYALRKKMIGNAVPPKLAEHLGKELRD